MQYNTIQCTMNNSTLTKRGRQSKLCLRNLNVIARRFFDEPRPGAQKTVTMEVIVIKLNDLSNPKKFLRPFVTVAETWIQRPRD